MTNADEIDLTIILLNIMLLVAVWWRGLSGTAASVICFCAVLTILLRAVSWFARWTRRFQNGRPARAFGFRKR
jgi:hypothetical protein